jgi:hypothetical protein
LETDLCNPDGGSVLTRKNAEVEFQNFVMQTYEELYAIKSKVLLAKSSIAVFVRFDIRLLVNNTDGRVHYFVNEVKCMQTTSLWSSRAHVRSPKAPSGILGSTLAETLYKWLLAMDNPYVV